MPSLANEIGDEYLRLRRIATRARVSILEMVHTAQAGHPGGALSVVDLLTALYFAVMRVDPANPRWPDRDRLVLSKGHASVALYAVLAEAGFLPREELATFDCINSRLQGHVDMTRTPGVDMSSGSLGQGLSVAAGMALGARMARRGFRVYVVLGDGELQEGQVWEAAMFAGARRLSNLTAIVDYNKIQLVDKVSAVLPIEPLVDKWRAFGWDAVEIDGHDMSEIVECLRSVRRRSDDLAASGDGRFGPEGLPGRPTVVIAHTVKGKGVSFMENTAEWHSKPPNDAQFDAAMKELLGQ